jgi:hypothetical protein
MCPACVTTLALIAAGGTSTGAIGALLVSKLCGKSTDTRNQVSDTDRRDAWRSEREVWATESEAWAAERDPWRAE